ncbi:MAG: hypothetical protein M3Y91_11810 [Actinomycetota bacterium]|nr:hypothetical protein [Actinomycetota bacterium]
MGPFHIAPTGDPTTWPDVCTFVNLAQVKAIDSQITGYKGDPVGSKAEVLGGSGNTPNNSSCKYNLTTSFDPADSPVTSYVKVSLQGVSPDEQSTWQTEFDQAKSTSAQYPDQFGDYPNLAGGTHCFYDGSQLQCIKGTYYFDVSGIKVTDGSNYNADQVAWTKDVVAPLAGQLGSELT